MIPQKKPYVKPGIIIVPLGTPKYKEIMAKIKDENEHKSSK